MFDRDLSPEEKSVRGSLVTGLSESDVRLLDVFEGDVSYLRCFFKKSLFTFDRNTPVNSFLFTQSPPLLPYRQCTTAVAVGRLRRCRLLSHTRTPVRRFLHQYSLTRIFGASPPPSFSLAYGASRNLSKIVRIIGQLVRLHSANCPILFNSYSDAWKWVGTGAQDNNDFKEVDRRREMGGFIIRCGRRGSVEIGC